jgi:hypothetical protein
MRPMLTIAITGLMLAAGPLAAQAAPEVGVEQALTAADLEIIRTELRADKRTKTAETLALTDAEAARFWPVYDRYIAELTVINDKKYGLIKEYSEKYGTYSNAQANDFITRWLDVDIKASKLRIKYVPIVGKVLPGIKAASFFQIDRRLAMLINLGLASQLPVLQAQTSR